MRHLSALLLAPLALLALLGSCASVDPRLEQDRAAVVAEVRARTGSAPDGESAANVRELLAAPFGPDEAVRAALALDPRVRELLATLGVASAESVRAGRIQNPLLHGEATFFGGGTELGFSLAAPLLELATLETRKDLAAAELAAARARAARGLVRIVHDVRRAWFDVRFDERDLELQRERLDAEEAAARLAQELHAAGNLVDPARTAVEVSLAEARLALAAAQGRSRDSREELARRVGVPELAGTLALAAEPEPAPLPSAAGDELEGTALGVSLDLGELRARTRASARAAGLAQWDALFDGATLGAAFRRELDGSGAGPSLALPLPLFDDGSAARVAAEQELAAVVARYDERVLDVRTAARALAVRAEDSAGREHLSREVLEPLARRHVDEVLQQYNAMQVGVFDVLEVRRRELEAAHTTLLHRRDAWRARVDLEELLAGSLPASPTDTLRADSRAY